MTLSDLRIETARLTLRLPRIEDFERYAELLADEEATRFIGGVQPRHAAWRKFLQMPGAWALQGFAMFSVVERSSGLWIGQMGPWQPDGWPGNEVGYVMHRDSWGRGYAVEAATAAIDWAFDNLDWDDVIHCIDPDNRASQQVARRLGSKNHGRGYLPAPLDTHTIDIWGQTRAEWRARKAAAA